ncbi:MAG TPA: Fic family protein [Rhodothermales bacterium]|nr:Fic family protein [Rhodothermales bacterium]
MKEARPPAITDRSFFRAYQEALQPEMPAALWDAFAAQEGLPPVRYAFQASAVYSSNIEGNTLDLNSYMRSKMRGGAGPKSKERREIDELVEAYEFARGHALTEKNLLRAHGILSRSILPASQQGAYRVGRMFVFDSRGIIYAAVEAEHVADEMRAFFEDVKRLRRVDLSVDEAFYHAAMMHLVFVHVHPFEDGNGRTARLLEKWFLTSRLGPRAWQIPSEEYYWKHRPAYYQAIRLGPDFYTVRYEPEPPEWGGCVPFLTLLPKSLRAIP